MIAEPQTAVGKRVFILQLPHTSQSTVFLLFRVVLLKDLTALHGDFEFYQSKLIIDS